MTLRFLSSIKFDQIFFAIEEKKVMYFIKIPVFKTQKKVYTQNRNDVTNNNKSIEYIYVL